ncbi:hypothetical protein ACJX0J_032180, partial [Zea mays]
YTYHLDLNGRLLYLYNFARIVRAWHALAFLYDHPEFHLHVTTHKYKEFDPAGGHIHFRAICLMKEGKKLSAFWSLGDGAPSRE